MSQGDDRVCASLRVVPSPAPEWLRRMQEDYQRTGAYRPSDVRRILGDPSSRVEIGPNSRPGSQFTGS